MKRLISGIPIKQLSKKSHERGYRDRSLSPDRSSASTIRGCACTELYGLCTDSTLALAVILENSTQGSGIKAMRDHSQNCGFGLGCSARVVTTIEHNKFAGGTSTGSEFQFRFRSLCSVLNGASRRGRNRGHNKGSAQQHYSVTVMGCCTTNGPDDA